MNLQKFKKNTKLKKNIISFAMVSLFLLAGIYLYTSYAYYEEKKEFNVINGTVQDPGDLYFAFYVDEVISKNMPAQGDGYILDNTKSSCTNGATPELDTENWSIIVKNMTIARTKCTLHFKKEPVLATTVLNNLVAGASSTSTDIYTVPNMMGDNCTYTLAYDGTSDNNLRYVGSNPCNYVTFNGESAGWRIIGILNTPEGQRVKLIRTSSIGDYSWDNKPSGTGSSTSSNGSNDWRDSTLKEVLNNGAYYNRTSGTCPSYTSSTTCDFTSNGLMEDSKKQIDSITWKLDVASPTTTSSNGKVSYWYTTERNSTKTWTGKVGLIYPSDYGYATSGGSTSNRSTCLNAILENWSNGSYGDCVNNDWLAPTAGLSMGEMTLTGSYMPGTSEASFMINLNSSGGLSLVGVAENYDVKPSIYLVTTASFSSGNGSQINPYILES